ncbi:MAG: calcium-binding protein [Xanthobacteraceae bacterium]|nr:calcium-binding protein [Xanthobacteraceae bacterium]
MAITASFIRSAGLLSIFGDANKNSIVASRDAAGNILVNGGAVSILGGKPTVANTAKIQLFGLSGDDILTIDESNGAMPAALMFGGDGNDTITGGSGNDMLFGQAGNDTLLGKGGNDLLFGGAGNDTLIGGTGDDQMFGEAGNDRMVWKPGEGTDLMEGGDGNDTAEVNGGNGAENFTITANGTRVRFDRITPAPFSLDIGTTENLVINANGGDDVITAGNGLGSLIKLTIDGGTGNDTITGGDGADTLIGGDGNDTINGGRGNDTALLGTGNDTFVWNPGDGSDTVEGQAGTDTLQFNGSNVGEKLNLSANGSRARLTRDVANITMDLNGMEQVNLVTLGGADNVTVGDLTGTGITQVNIDLGATPGGTGDGVADVVTVNGTGGGDVVSLVNSANATVFINGLAADMTIVGADGSLDTLVVNGLGGNDTLDASFLNANWINLTLDGGAGNDIIKGSRGADTLIGGTGNDTVTGGTGNDFANLGDGTDTFVWNPGDGSDTVEGGSGTDTLVFNGSNVAERMDVSANGGRVRLSRDVGAITMDLNSVEHIQLSAAGGADTITVNDLSGTGVTQVAIDLGATAGAPGGDGQADTVIANGTNAGDQISVVNSGGSVVVKGLAAQVLISNAEAGDSLVVNGLGGDDVINASAIKAGQVQLTLNGGDGNDLITGSGGDDLVNGGRGNDVALLGGGNDTFVWNPGDGSDTVEGQSGTDTLQFNGANISERFDISANGGRVRFTRDVANITMDLNDVENINVTALGGNDVITVNDLTGTDIKQVAIDLSATPGSGVGDGAADTIILNATNGDDVITISESNGVITVSGLGEDVIIKGFEGANDRIVINGLGGDDVITASGLPAGIQITANGGDGDDILIGGLGNDTLLGGNGDDVLLGGGGQDVLDGGPGDNVVIQGFAASASGAALLGQFMASSFAPAGQGLGVTPIADPQAGQQPVLAMSQHA